MVNRLISTTLGIVGGVVGGFVGFHLFFWIVKQGFYAMVLPGAAVGLGCGLLARHRSVLRGTACAIAGLVLGLYTEWIYAPFVADKRFGYLVTHFLELRPITQIMIGLGAALSYYLGRDAGFLSPRSSAVASAKGKSKPPHEVGD